MAAGLLEKHAENIPKIYLKHSAREHNQRMKSFYRLLREWKKSALIFPRQKHFTGPRNVTNGSGDGLLDTDLKAGAQKALRIASEKRVVFFQNFSWKQYVRSFLSNLDLIKKLDKHKPYS